MRIHFVNVGYGEAILVEKNGRSLLVDGGTNRADEYEAQGCIRITEYLKRAGISHIDLIIVTHIHDDHIGGIPEVLKHFAVSKVLMGYKPAVPDLKKIKDFESVRQGNLSGQLFKNALECYEQLIAECGRQNIPILQRCYEDGHFCPIPGLTLEFLSPDCAKKAEMLDAYNRLCEEKEACKAEMLFYEIDRRGNNTSIALKISAGKTAVLLTGDKTDGWEEIWEKFGASLKSGILKVAHHGQLDGLPDAMIRVSEPDHFVICASADRRFNSAHPEIIRRIRMYLMQKQIEGGVYLTGSLEGEKKETKPCAVYFDCNEDSGEVTVAYA
jgi:competence protein ComEC